MPYKAFGLGASSFDGISRFQNETDLESYCQKIEQGKDVTVFTETLTEDQRYLERLMLGLRRKNGLAREEVITGFADKKKMRGQFIQSCIDEGLLYECNGRLILTSAGLMLESEIITQLVVR